MAGRFDLEKIDHNLELKEDLLLQSKAWRIRAIGWLLIFLFVILAAFGLFGTGLLSNRNIFNNGDTLSYEGFSRNEAKTYLDFKLHNQTGTTRIGFTQGYLKNFQVDKVVPETHQVQLQNGSIVYTFLATQTSYIRFYLVPEKTGSITGTILVNNQPYRLSQFIYP